jgi:hypothetical protein
MTVTPANEPAPKQSWWWPSVETATTARKAIRKAFWVTVILAVVTAAFAALWLGSGVAPLELHDAWSLADSILFAVLAIFVFRGSRVATTLTLVFYVVESLYLISKNALGAGSIVTTVVFTLALIHGLRGAFALRKHLATATLQPGLPNAGN